MELFSDFKYYEAQQNVYVLPNLGAPNEEQWPDLQTIKDAGIELAADIDHLDYLSATCDKSVVVPTIDEIRTALLEHDVFASKPELRLKLWEALNVLQQIDTALRDHRQGRLQLVERQLFEIQQAQRTISRRKIIFGSAATIAAAALASRLWPNASNGQVLRLSGDSKQSIAGTQEFDLVRLTGNSELEVENLVATRVEISGDAELTGDSIRAEQIEIRGSGNIVANTVTSTTTTVSGNSEIIADIKDLGEVTISGNATIEMSAPLMPSQHSSQANSMTL